MAQPVSHAEFTNIMALLGPFETAPHLAVAVSGGSDSLALLLLLHDWIAAHDGCLTALSVDHGLRPEAAVECRQVGEIVATINRLFPDRPPIRHEILTWQGEKPATGLMSAARGMRYRLLADWCRGHDVLHLAVGHHADDQAETVLMRREHGSAAFGLAGMSAIRMLDGVRLLRPLLPWRKAELQALVVATRLTWIEDPSNSKRQFERVRRRDDLSTGNISGNLSGDLLSAAREAGRQRDETVRLAASWLAEHGRIDPAGFVTLPVEFLLAVAEDVAVQILRDLLRLVGGGEFAPAPDLITRLIQSLRNGSLTTMSLGGCLAVTRYGQLSLFREAAGCERRQAIEAGRAQIWDHRFLVRLAGPSAIPVEMGAIGEWGLANRPVPPDLTVLPHLARTSLPGIWRDGKLLTYGVVSTADRITDHAADAAGSAAAAPADGQIYKLDVSFNPDHPATSCGFTVVCRPGHTM